MCVCTKSLLSCLTLPRHGLLPDRLLCPRNSPGKNTGVACHALLQRIFPTQGSKLLLLAPALQADSLQLRDWEHPHELYFSVSKKRIYSKKKKKEITQSFKSQGHQKPGSQMSEWRFETNNPKVLLSEGFRGLFFLGAAHETEHLRVGPCFRILFLLLRMG